MTDYLHALPPGYRIEEYELVRVLGSGGFGITYLGYDHHLDKADYEWGLARFLNEAQTLARFDHRHIIKIHRFFRAHGTGYSVMEYAEGETLSEVLQRKGTLTESELKQLLFPILDGLEAVHGADFLHRDIKPSNIVIRDDGSPVLIDFGSARQAVAGKSRSVTAIVTPGYAPIEQYSVKGHQGPWTDIYGLGAVCYRCLTGEAPDDATERLRKDPLVPISKRCKGEANTSLLNAIDRALRVDERKRPQTIVEWRKMLSNKTAVPTYRQRKETTKPADRSSLSSFLITRGPGLLSVFLLSGLVFMAMLFWDTEGEGEWVWIGAIAGVIFLISTFPLLGALSSSLTEEFRLLSLWLLSGLLFMVMLFWNPEGWWTWVAVIAMAIIFVCTISLIAVGDAIVVVLIISGMFSILLPFKQEVVWGIIMVSIAARIIIKYGVWSE